MENSNPYTKIEKIVRTDSFHSNFSESLLNKGN